MAASSDVIVRLRAVGAQAFKAGMDSAAHSVLSVGTAAGKTEAKVKSSAATAERSGKSWRVGARGLAKFAGGAAALYAAKRGIESAVKSTEELARGTIFVSRSTGMDAKEASMWVEMTRARGVETATFQRTLVQMSKMMENATGGAKKAVNVFDKLGISADTYATGDVTGVLMQTADAFQHMQNPAEKAALASQLFGRSALKMMPFLNKGSASIREQMALVEKYGATIGDTKDAQELISKQREMTYAMDGVKVQLGEALMPVILKGTELLVKFAGAMRPITQNSTAVVAVLSAVSAAFVAYKAVAFAAMLTTLGVEAAFLAIPAAIAAVVVGLTVLYFKWDAFHKLVDSTFGWIRKHWPLLFYMLTGPLGVAVAYMIKNFGTIKSAVRGVAGAFRSAFSAVKSIVDSTVHWIADRLRQLLTMIGRVVDTIKSLPSKAGGVLGKIASHTPQGMAVKGVRKLFGGEHGGVVPFRAMTLVGEAGPELLSLPRGASVTPLPTPSIGGVATTAHFYLDRRLVATAVARDTADRKARR